MVQMYLIHVSVDLGEISEQYHAQHIEFLNQQFDNKVFLTFGRNLSKNSAGVIIAQAENQDELERIVALDPYVKHRCANYEIEEFSPLKIAKDFHFFK